jgi:hypothetical protein
MLAGSLRLMRRGSKVAVVAIAVVLAFIFFVPVMQVGFVTVLPPTNCHSLYGEMISGCGYLYIPGKASITYWAFGIGGTYGSVNNSGYGLGLATCSTYTGGNTSTRMCSAPGTPHAT